MSLDNKEAVYSSTTETSSQTSTGHRGFDHFKRILFVSLVACLIGTIASIPWCLEFTKMMYELEDGSTSKRSDSWIYSTVTVATMVPVFVIIYGVVGILYESFSKSLFFSFFAFLLAISSARFYANCYIFISMVIEVVLGILFLVFAALVKKRKIENEKHNNRKDNFFVYVI